MLQTEDLRSAADSSVVGESAADRSLRVALVSTGLGRTLRGFESFTESLFQNLRRTYPHWDVVLFKGGGRRETRQKIVPRFRRDGFPARWLSVRQADFLEKRSFGAALYPKLRAGRFDIVHYNELTMGSALWHLRRAFGGRFKLLYCNGAPSPPIHYHHRCDVVQTLTEPMHREAVEFGISTERLAFVPYGVDAQRFQPVTDDQRRAARARLQIPGEGRLIVTVAALKREHKRIDYLINEVAELGADCRLLVAGQESPDTPGLRELAQRKLGDRWRFVSLPHDQLPDVYAAADVFVLPSLTEGLPIVVLEALASGLPVVLHNQPLFCWTAGPELAHSLIDMSQDGALANKLKGMSDQTASICKAARKRALETFAWETLLPQYVELYRRVAAMDRARVGD
jgi:1,2-diacylglycerol 3-alpha-glucosyltransferase